MGAGDFFLKINEIPGESQDDKHKGEIDIEGWSWGVTRPGRDGSPTGKAEAHDINITLKASKASPELFKALVNNVRIKEAVLVARRAEKRQEYLTITLNDCFVTSWSQSGSELSDGPPMEQAALSFSKVKFGFAGQKADFSLEGMVYADYDFKAGK